jgi:hypothetical protein
MEGSPAQLQNGFIQVGGLLYTLLAKPTSNPSHWADQSSNCAVAVTIASQPNSEIVENRSEQWHRGVTMVSPGEEIL